MKILCFLGLIERYVSPHGRIHYPFCENEARPPSRQLIDYYIENPNRQKITLKAKIHDFPTEHGCNSNRIEILDGPQRDEKDSKHYCGNESEILYQSESHVVLFRLILDTMQSRNPTLDIEWSESDGHGSFQSNTGSRENLRTTLISSKS